MLPCAAKEQDKTRSSKVEFSSAQFVALQAFKKWLLFGIWVLFFFNIGSLCFNLTIALLGLHLGPFAGSLGPGSAGHHFGHAACLAQWIQTCESRNQDAFGLPDHGKKVDVTGK